MASFYKSGFLSLYVNKAWYMNQPVNMDKITRIRIYDRIIGADKHEDSDYRIYFEGENQVCWRYDTIEKRNYEYESLLDGMTAVTRPSYNFAKYLEDNVAQKKTEEEENSEEDAVEKEDIFIYRKDDSFFVTRDEHKVKAENTHYEKGILL